MAFRTWSRALAIAAVTVRRSCAALPAIALSGRGSRRAVLRKQLRTLVTELGPSFVKGAQLLSTRQDLLPREICEALGRLHDQVAPMSEQDAREAVRSAYAGRPWPFADFDWEPIASGSIACVYRAVLTDGRQVAVKVRRVGIAPRMRADFALAESGARLMQRLPGMRGLPAGEIVGQCRDAVLAQLDFAAEADALDALRRNLGDLAYLRVPEPVREAGAEGVLVMEYLPGLRRIEPAELPAEVAELVVRRVLRCAYRMLFINGLVHCDLHPGNLYIAPDGGIVILDAGFVVRLEPKVRRLFAEFFLNMARGNGPYCAGIVIRSARSIGEHADLDAFREGIGALVAGAASRPARDFRLAPFAAKLFDLQRRSGLYAAPEFVFPLLSLLVLEGMINDFHADVDFQNEAKPVLFKALLTGVPIERKVS
ncbi:ABC1 kinase family protein [Nonomuraea sp. NPDC003727]